jgi:hypothetical protein
MALRKIKGSGITDGTVGADDLASTLNLSSKTVTLPEASVTDHATTATPANVSDTANTSTGYFDIPAGTTAQRPGSPAVGNIRFNTTTVRFEGYNGTNWVPIDTLYS